MLDGHEDHFFDNDGLMPTSEIIGSFYDNCDEPAGMTTTRGNNNRYYTPHGNASATCDGVRGAITLAQLALISPLTEVNFTTSVLPTNDWIVALAKVKLGLPPA